MTENLEQMVLDKVHRAYRKAAKRQADAAAKLRLEIEAVKLAEKRRMQKGSSSEKKRKPAGLAGEVSKIPKGAGKQTSRAKKPKASCEKTVPDKLPVCGAQKQSQSARGVDEIDQLFATAKNAKAATAQQQLGDQADASQAAVKGSRDDIFGNGLHRGRRRTEEGYAIYQEDELNLNRGGKTPLCPFDCDCCF